MKNRHIVRRAIEYAWGEFSIIPTEKKKPIDNLKFRDMANNPVVIKKIISRLEEIE